MTIRRWLHTALITELLRTSRLLLIERKGGRGGRRLLLIARMGRVRGRAGGRLVASDSVQGTGGGVDGEKEGRERALVFFSFWFPCMVLPR